MPIEFRVAKIISPLQVVLNGGERAGVRLGQHFVIFGHGEEIRDPVTHEVLEKVQIRRGLGKVVHLQDRICILESSETHLQPKPPNPFVVSLGSPEMQTVPKPFKEVQVGDYAKLV